MVSQALVSSATLARTHTHTPVSLWRRLVSQLFHFLLLFYANQYPPASAVTDFGHWFLFFYFLFPVGRRRRQHSSSLRGIEIDIVPTLLVFTFSRLCVRVFSPSETNNKYIVELIIRLRARALTNEASRLRNSTSKAIEDDDDDIQFNWGGGVDVPFWSGQ